MRFPRIDLRARAENLVVSEGYTVVDFVKPNIELKDTYLMPIKVRVVYVFQSHPRDNC